MKNYLYSLVMLLALFYFLTHCGTYRGKGTSHSTASVTLASEQADSIQLAGYKGQQRQ
ncbi:MAG TPA: hypothetical protein VGO45_09670 [Bacteroidia bacterium]|jgi:hypothetical protein|nr:hypothetical protein [Bacteroidia bacterium]